VPPPTASAVPVRPGPSGPPLGRARSTLARLAGPPVAAAFGGIARLRRARGLHPRGPTFDATLTLDERLGGLGEGVHPAVVRLSRGAGLPAWAPDVLGLAVRVVVDGSRQDLLVSSSHHGSRLRHLPLPARRFDDAFFTTLTHVAVDGRRTMVAARGDGPGRFQVLRPVGGWWEPVGAVVVGEPRPDAEDAALDMDPWHIAAGIVPLGFLSALRRSAYAASRRGRARPVGTPVDP
jgi:hypothetical protein